MDSPPRLLRALRLLCCVGKIPAPRAAGGHGARRVFSWETHALFAVLNLSLLHPRASGQHAGSGKQDNISPCLELPAPLQCWKNCLSSCTFSPSKHWQCQ
ncbi:hypothetical protein NDU88_003235 [Pleurodeles waltl]|uniref:Secreted protein n=1 Tax=Pleurodeles waltl TaxID=8319 RepID=A0AAV7SFZ7_PLEWA|nr:hypothetical protein NDU88_003235 [Pleurodeles waltl]